MLLGKPGRPELEPQYDIAVRIVEKSPVVETVTEEQAPLVFERFAQEIKDRENTTP